MASENNREYLDKNEEKDSNISFRQILDFAWALRYWIVLSVIFSLGVAYIIVRKTTPIYKRTASILLVNNENNASSSSELALVAELTGKSFSQKIENEMVILKSATLMRNVVDELKVNIRYLKVDAFRNKDQYRYSPVELIYVKGEGQSKVPAFNIEISIEDENTYKVDEFELAKHYGIYDYEHEIFKFGERIACSSGYFIINYDATKSNGYSDILITVADPADVAAKYAEKLVVENAKTSSSRMANASDIISISLEDSSPLRAEDILNTLITMYNREAKSFKNISVTNTITFIDERLTKLEGELGTVESNITQYREQKSILNVESQSQIALTSDLQYEDKLTGITTQLKLLEMISDNMKSHKNEHTILPANIGISDAGLSGSIELYNQLLIECNRLLASSTATNPRVVSATQQLDQIRESIVLSIQNLQ
ncbi:MAG: Wzz/FepE/Etk N-terminal domain-containing protein, partial [Bacteroidales bacterium]|nr:Wzz/FepE/Etk N-terminal domain-containing protein [Bacteroidales bacterium]